MIAKTSPKVNIFLPIFANIGHFLKYCLFFLCTKECPRIIMVIDSGKVTASDALIQSFRTLLLMKNAPKQETETEGNHYETLRA